MNPDKMTREEKIKYIEIVKESIVISACNNIIEEIFKDKKNWDNFRGVEKLEIFEVLRQSSQLKSKYSG